MTPRLHPENDGVTHINIYSKGETSLGRFLSNFAHSPTVIEGIEFASIEAYWYWLGTGRKHDILITLHGWQAKSVGKTFEKVPIDNFNDLICEALRCKLRQHKHIRDALKESSLPLAHYYYFGTRLDPKIVYLPQYQWIVDEFERLRGLLQNRA